MAQPAPDEGTSLRLESIEDPRVRRSLEKLLDLLAEVDAAIGRIYGSGGTPEEALEGLRQLPHLLGTLLADEPLTDSERRLKNDIQQQVNYMLGLVEKAECVSLAPDTPRFFHRTVLWLLHVNYDVVRQIVGRKAVNAELLAIAKCMTRGRKGRPKELPISQVKAARRLYDEGRTYPEIAKQLGLRNAGTVRTALLHHFSDMRKPRSRSTNQRPRP